MEEQDDQVSMTVEDSDGGEAILEDSAGSETDDQLAHFAGLLKIREETREYDGVKKTFLTGMKGHAKDTQVVAIYKNSASTSPMKARFAAFQAFEQVVSQKNGGQGNANVKYAWYSGSKEEISQIISHGFGWCNGQSHGVGVYLSPFEFLLDAVKFTIADENDMRYMLLCHLTMGNMEVIPAGSKQVYPSSVEFDTGVDNLEAPRRLIVWSAFMNSHICPAYIITFKAPFFGFVLSRDQISELPGITLSFHGSALTFPALFPILVKVIGPAKAGLIYKSLVDRKKCKITQEQMIQTTRRIIGNDWRLIAMIKSSIDKAAASASSSKDEGRVNK